MDRLRRRGGALLVPAALVAALAGGCDGDDGNGGEGGGDPSGWAIDRPPRDVEVVDTDLVARVVAELDVHLGDLHRAVAREGAVGELAEALAHSIYVPEAVPAVLQRLSARLPDVRDDVATPRSAIVELGTVDTGCVDALVRRDLGPVLDVPDDEAIATWAVTLVVVDDSDNGTTWRMAGDEPGQRPPSACG